MTSDLSVSFEELREARRQLATQCKLHETSLRGFKADGLPWYRVNAGEPLPAATNAGRGMRHLSTSASCLQSLGDLPTEDDAAKRLWLQQLIDDFALSALGSGVSWESDGAAQTYCRVRTLPIILERADHSVFTPSTRRHVSELLWFAWARVAADSGRQGIAEHATIGGGAGTLADERTYPPNAFLSYWGMRCLRGARERKVKVGTKGAGVADRAAIVLLWCRATLGMQVALRDSGSDRFDPHQLAWALATIVEFGDRDEMRQAATLALVKAGLAAFFGAQEDAGGWRRGEPLFHYPLVGNAYCYTFETLGELIRPALRRDAVEYRDLLRPHAHRLLVAWRSTEAGQRPIAAGAMGWCSEHHPQQTEPEAWATAAVFSFLQLLWRLVGCWAREAAARTLEVTTPRWPEEGEALTVLRKRGDTWPVVDGWTTGNLLAGLFLNPIRHGKQPGEWLEPDAHLIGDSQARGAILFGPPGTGKTTLVEALASALGWEYVEIQASQFLADGMANVPARADAVFKSVMELDRCVVLFDEIDELLRERKDSDPFGRFLTTSMLPKLAKLWEQRRVLYFVNTNWIEKTDNAIKRSQRFDAAIFVPPPSLSAKIAFLGDSLSARCKRSLTHEAVNTALDEGEPLGWLALLRHDQLATVRNELGQGASAGKQQLETALARLGSQLLAAEVSDGVPTPTTMFHDFQEMGQRVQIDDRAVRAALLDRNAAGMTSARLPKRFKPLTAWKMPVVLLELPPRLHDPQSLDFGTRTLRGDTLLHFPTV